MRFKVLSVLIAGTTAATLADAQTGETWATYRGNPARTGSDGQAGPREATVLWAFKSRDHYIASPLPLGDRLYVSGLGAFNRGLFACLSTRPDAKTRTLWARQSTGPTVSSPGAFKSWLIFGDGMHQTNGASVYCLDAVEGRRVWRRSIRGDLVHVEGSPTLVDGKAYVGGGNAGVLCFEIERATLNGKAYGLPELQKLNAATLKELQAKYEIARKTDPFAFPPSEDQLPEAEPKLLWQQGKDKWHVDAPINVVGDRVLVCSAFLDEERVGDRALFCLDAKTGDLVWRVPLKINPWGGPSVLGATVVVSGSSIGYDHDAIKGAKGSIAAYDLKKGELKWHKDIPGGVVACAALASNSAVVTSTDGKVRAFDMATGERQWIYDAKHPLFAPAAIAKDIVYAGDLASVIHAIDLNGGAGLWKLDLGAHPKVQAPGMIYAGPVVSGGRLHTATCNLQGPAAGGKTVVVCVGE